MAADESGEFAGVTAEEMARRLLADGYNAPLVSSRLAREKELSAQQADAIVERLGGGTIDLEKQRGTQSVLLGLALLLGGAVMMMLSWQPPRTRYDSWTAMVVNAAHFEHDYFLGLAGLAVMAFGVARLVTGLRQRGGP
jgi:hypothetical protein